MAEQLPSGYSIEPIHDDDIGLIGTAYTDLLQTDAGLHAIRNLFHGITPPPDEYLQRLDSDLEQGVIARDYEGNICGWAGLFSAPDYPNLDAGILVTPDHQGQGLGTEMLRNLITIGQIVALTDETYSAIQIIVSTDNIPAYAATMAALGDLGYKTEVSQGEVTITLPLHLPFS